MSAPAAEKRIRIRVRQSISSSEGWAFSPGVFDVPVAIATLLLRNNETAIRADGEALGVDFPCRFCGQPTFGPPSARRCSGCGEWVPPAVP